MSNNLRKLPVLTVLLCVSLGAMSRIILAATTITNIIPLPISVASTGGGFTLPSTAAIFVNPGTSELTAIGQYLADKMKPATGFALPVTPTTSTPANDNIYLTTVGGDSTLGAEGYLLTVTSNLVTLQAYQPAGLFRGIQTIRQMLPDGIESQSVLSTTWTLATGTIRDYPRYAYRSSMMDIGHHYFSPEYAKKFIDEIACYKFNIFHIHLADFNYWSPHIASWPKLGVSGTSWTQAEYSDIINYAKARYITVVPEIDMPGHSTAAISAYPNLGSGSNLNTDAANLPYVLQYVKDVIREVATLSPGPYFHIGGDESSVSNYTGFIDSVRDIVQKNGKTLIGWDETSAADLTGSSVAQYSSTIDRALTAVSKGEKIIMSPWSYTYLDYTNSNTGVEKTYSWNPGTLVTGISDSNILGIDAPIWSDIVVNNDFATIETQGWPRLAGLAEVAWSPFTGRNWNEYKVRLASHGPRLALMGINYFQSSEVPWPINSNVVTTTVNDHTTGAGQNQFEYVGNWNPEPFSGAYLNDDTWSGTTNDSYNIRFTGTMIKIYAATAPNHGIAGVSIDGGLERLVDLYSATRMNNILIFNSPTLNNGSHILKVRVTGSWFYASTGPGILVDRVDIISGSTTKIVDNPKMKTKIYTTSVAIVQHPFNPIIKIIINTKNDIGIDKAEVEVFDISGKSVIKLHRNIVQGFLWDAGKQGNGLYVIRTRIGNKTYLNTVLLQK